MDKRYNGPEGALICIVRRLTAEMATVRGFTSCVSHEVDSIALNMFFREKTNEKCG